MSNSFDFEEFKAQAIEKLKAGVPLSGKDGILAPLLENLLNSALGGEMDSHHDRVEREKILADSLADQIINRICRGLFR